MNSILPDFVQPLAGRRLHALAMMAVFFLGSIGAAVPARAWEMRVCADPDNMPFSRRDLAGYENKIAEMLADDLHAKLTFVWWPQVAEMVSDQLREGKCDIIMGSPETSGGVLPTIAYYRSPFAFVYRSDAGYDISDFDTERLKTLKIGFNVRNSPPDQALIKRGLAQNIVTLPYNHDILARDDDDRPPVGDGPEAGLFQALVKGDFDVAIPWGPVAGYFASRQKVPLTVVPTPEFDLPFLPMYISMVIAVREGDESLRDQLNVAIADRWDDINAVLKDYGVPLLDLPQPTATIGGK
jgi:quinoprotein dehydrogenase-associated probable ABC transporter substrate-binding protein